MKMSFLEHSMKGSVKINSVPLTTNKHLQYLIIPQGSTLNNHKITTKKRVLT